MRRLCAVFVSIALAVYFAGAQNPSRAEQDGFRFLTGDFLHIPEPGRNNGPPGGSPDAPFDPGVFSLADSAISLLSRNAHDAISRRLTGFKLATVEARRAARDKLGQRLPGAQFERTKDGFSPEGLGTWTNVFGLSQIDRRTDAIDEFHTFAGATLGLDFPVSDKVIAGIFFGGSTGSLIDDDTLRDVSTNGFYGGFYVARAAGDLFFDLTVNAGLADQRTSRDAYHLSDPETSYAAYFVNPAFHISTYREVFGQTVIPSLGVSYSGTFFDAYSDVTTGQHLNVEDRSSHLVSTRAQLTLPFTRTTSSGAALSIESIAGVKALMNLSPATVMSTPQGLQYAIPASDKDHEIAAFLGSSISYTLTSGLRLYSDFEGFVNTQGSLDGTLRLGGRFSF